LVKRVVRTQFVRISRYTLLIVTMSLFISTVRIAKNNLEVFIMLDMKFLRNNFEDVKAKLEHRGEDLSELDKFGELDEKRRKLITEGESLKAKRNEASKQ